MANGEINHEVFDRLGAAEQDIAAIKTDTASTKSMVIRIDQALSNQQKTNWSVILAAIGISVVIISGLFGLGVNPLQRDVNDLAATLITLVKEERLARKEQGLRLAEERRTNDIYIWEETRKDRNQREEWLLRYFERDQTWQN